MERSDGRYATVQIPSGIFKKLEAKWPEFQEFEDDYRYQDKVKLTIRYLSVEQMEFAIELLKAGGNTGSAAQVTGFMNAINNPGEKVSNLIKMEASIAAWMRKDAIRGWLFRIADELPELITDVTYHPAGDDYPASVSVRTQYIACDENDRGYFSLYASDCGKTVDQIMLEHGYVHEDKGLHAQYDALEKKYLEWRGELGRQYITRDTGEKLVNDTTGPAEKFKRKRYGDDYYEDNKPDPEKIKLRAINKVFKHVRNQDEDDETSVDARFTRIPVHPFLFFFNLALKNHLILPPDHRNLIDALTKDLSIVAEDIVADKVGGITILCQGRPGTGKTLTAEVYSEVVGKPLYRVHSGQLGTEPQGLEANLVLALERSSRWGAVLLIDEADVFLMQRTDDLIRNAVVGVFLRTLEYYRGLLFLTTNRLDAIDDAIISRCIAVIRYDNPGVPERRAIWRTQLDLACVELSDELVEQLAQHFNASGRDIKGLVKLTARYCRAHAKPIEFDDFVSMATFRGL